MRHNYLAIIVVVIISMVLGFLWYGFIFGEAWSQGVFHKSMADMQASMKGKMDPTPYIINIIGIACIALFTSWLIQKMDTRGFMDGMLLGLYIAIGTSVPVIAIHYMFLQMDYAVMGIDVGMTTLSMVLTGGILAAWRK